MQRFSPLTKFLVRVIVITLLVSVPTVLVINNPTKAQSLWESNPVFFVLFSLPIIFVIIRRLTRKKK
jgi:hypothetical protein